MPACDGCPTTFPPPAGKGSRLSNAIVNNRIMYLRPLLRGRDDMFGFFFSFQGYFHLPASNRQYGEVNILDEYRRASSHHRPSHHDKVTAD